MRMYNYCHNTIGDGRSRPMAYGAWRNFEGAGKEEACVHIELNDKMRWSDKSCSLKSKGFICQTGKSYTAGNRVYMCSL
jgi:hypothetical protein